MTTAAEPRYSAASRWRDRIAAHIEEISREERRTVQPRLRDEVTAEHQIGFRLDGHRIAVTCACLRLPRRGRPGYGLIDARPVFPAAEALAAWRAWHEQNGVAL